MATSTNWKDVNVNFGDVNSLMVGAGQTLSRSGDIFGRLASQFQANRDREADLAYRYAALEQQAQDKAADRGMEGARLDQQYDLAQMKLGQDQNQFNAEMAFNQAKENRDRDFTRVQNGQKAYMDAQAASAVKLPPYEEWVKGTVWDGEISNYGPSGASAVGNYGNKGFNINDLGSLSRKYESGSKGSLAYNPNDNGHGPSFGSYQLNGDSIRGFANFIGGEAGQALAASGNKKGTWDALVKSGAITPEKEHAYIKSSHYDPAMAALNPNVRAMVEQDPRLQQALWSASVQHGPGNGKSGSKGAAAIFNDAFAQNPDDFIGSIYSIRANRYGGTAGIKERLSDELSTLRSASADMPQNGSVVPQAASSPSTPGNPTSDPITQESEAMATSIMNDYITVRNNMELAKANGQVNPIVADQAGIEAEMVTGQRMQALNQATEEAKSNQDIASSTTPSETPQNGATSPVQPAVVESEPTLAADGTVSLGVSGTSPIPKSESEVANFGQNARDAQAALAFQNADKILQAQWMTSQGISDPSQIANNANGIGKMKEYVRDHKKEYQSQVKQAWAQQYMKDLAVEGQPMDYDNYKVAEALLTKFTGDNDLKNTPIQAEYDIWKRNDDLRKETVTSVRDDLKSATSRLAKQIDTGGWLSGNKTNVITQRVDKLSNGISKLLEVKGYNSVVSGAVADALLKAQRGSGGVRSTYRDPEGALTTDWFGEGTGTLDEAIKQVNAILDKKNPQDYISKRYLDDGTLRGNFLGDIIANLDKADLIPKNIGTKMEINNAAYDAEKVANDLLAEKAQADAIKANSSIGSVPPNRYNALSNESMLDNFFKGAGNSNPFTRSISILMDR